MLKNGVAIFIVIFIAFALINLTRQIQDAIKAGERLNQASDELQVLQEKNRFLNKQLGEQTTPDYIEQQARDKLNLSRPNETIIVIDPEALKSYLEASATPTPSPIPNYQGWLRLFWN